MAATAAIGATRSLYTISVAIAAPPVVLVVPVSSALPLVKSVVLIRSALLLVDSAVLVSSTQALVGSVVLARNTSPLDELVASTGVRLGPVVDRAVTGSCVYAGDLAGQDLSRQLQYQHLHCYIPLGCGEFFSFFVVDIVVVATYNTRRGRRCHVASNEGCDLCTGVRGAGNLALEVRIDRAICCRACVVSRCYVAPARLTSRSAQRLVCTS